MRVKQVGISLPKDIVGRIDDDRRDIPRSKYILRLIENFYKAKETVTKL